VDGMRDRMGGRGRMEMGCRMKPVSSQAPSRHCSSYLEVHLLTDWGQKLQASLPRQSEQQG
jgi:hypothetical protein